MNGAGAEGNGKALLVTGAGSGIRRAVAVAAARHGHRVELWDRDAEAACLSEVAPALLATSVVDVGSSEQIDGAFEAVVAGGVPIDHVMNNAGPSSYVRRRFEEGLQEVVASMHWVTQAWLRTSPLLTHRS